MIYQYLARVVLLLLVILHTRHSLGKTSLGLQSPNPSLARTYSYTLAVSYVKPSDDQNEIALVPVSVMILGSQYVQQTLNNHHILKMPLYFCFLFSTFQISFHFSHLCAIPFEYHLTWQLMLSLCFIRSSSDFNDAITIFSRCSLNLGIRFEKLSACLIFSDGNIQCWNHTPVIL